MAYNRRDRVGDLIRQEIASMLIRAELKDPRIGFVTITRVKMSPDLKHARVFFSVIGMGESGKSGAKGVPATEVAESVAGLNSAVPHIRRTLARRLKLKSIPVVVFEFDDSIEYADRIERVKQEIKEKEGRA